MLAIMYEFISLAVPAAVEEAVAASAAAGEADGARRRLQTAASQQLDDRVSQFESLDKLEQAHLR